MGPAAERLHRRLCQVPARNCLDIFNLNLFSFPGPLANASAVSGPRAEKIHHKPVLKRCIAVGPVHCHRYVNKLPSEVPPGSFSFSLWGRNNRPRDSILSEGEWCSLTFGRAPFVLIKRWWCVKSVRLTGWLIIVARGPRWPDLSSSFFLYDLSDGRVSWQQRGYFLLIIPELDVAKHLLGRRMQLDAWLTIVWNLQKKRFYSIVLYFLKTRNLIEQSIQQFAE